jgi:hypothetical protein
MASPAGLDDPDSISAVPQVAAGGGPVFPLLCAITCGLILARPASLRREFSIVRQMVCSGSS